MKRPRCAAAGRLPVVDAADYLTLGKKLIPSLLNAELAAPWIEVEARISDAQYAGSAAFVEPHHLSQARQELEAEGRIAQRREATRGGRPVTLWTLAGPGSKATDRAAARKRLLAARYLGWAQGTPSRPGITGPAAEQVVHASSLAAAPYGFALANPAGPGVETFLGLQVPIGPLDGGLLHTSYVEGQPAKFAAIPIEVKNLRDWIYPQSQELYQLLDKAAQLQQARPDTPIAPVLVCRRAHITTMRMAKELGFFVVMTRRQYIATSAAEEKILELRRELGLTDLVPQVDADRRITDSFVKFLPKVLDRTTTNWAASAETLGDYFPRLRTETDSRTRSELLLEMKQHLRAEWGLEFNLGW